MTPREIRYSNTRHLGLTVWMFDEVPSTNDLAARFALDPARIGTVFVAANQTHGRGQYGRIWQARPGSSLLLSVLLAPPIKLRRPVILTAWAAVAIAEAISELAGVEARIKWPNDLLIGGKKVSGILIEQGAGVVVGLGLNLNQTVEEFAEAELRDATSLGIANGSNIDPALALGTVVRHLDDGYTRLLAGEHRDLESRWKRRSGLLGQSVRIELNDGSARVGRLRDMSFDGVEIETGEFAIDAIRPESIRGMTANRLA